MHPQRTQAGSPRVATRSSYRAAESPAPGAAAGAAILSKEQQAEVDRFRKTAAEKRRELKEVRKDLRADSEALQFWVKVMNIALIPALLVVLGVSLMIYRRRSTK
jgi:cobalamin biosynthesis Mg chelatase CobN